MNNTQLPIQKAETKTPAPKPNDAGGFVFSTSVKITDLTDNKIVLQQRGN